jgi:hypothetical protein
MQARLIYKVEPLHPMVSTGVSGSVDLDGRTDMEGTVTKIVATNSSATAFIEYPMSRGAERSADSMIRSVATDAVKKWRYSPVLLGGTTPVSVTFPVHIDFLPDGTVDTGKNDPRTVVITGTQALTTLSESTIVGLRPLLISNDPLDTVKPSESRLVYGPNPDTYEGRRYYSAETPGISRPDIRIDKPLVLAAAASDEWPKYDINKFNPLMIGIYINENGGIDGVITNLRIPALEAEQTQLEQELSSGSLSNDELLQKSQRISRILEELDEKALRWMELSEKITDS